MTTEHPITLSSELFEEWVSQTGSTKQLVETALQCGADMELEACCDWLGGGGYAGMGSALRAARRPKPPSLKEQALAVLPKRLGSGFMATINDKELDILRRAIEALPND
jgi:hypothetical protein